MTISYIPHQIDEQAISIIHANQTYLIPNTAINFQSIRKALLEGNYDAIPSLLDTKSTLEAHSSGAVSCDGNEVLYKGEPVHNSACTKLLNLMADGLSNINPWLKFIEKLMANPSHNSREQAYKFIELKGMPLTEDGNIIGYKGVAENYFDKWSGKFDNSVDRKSVV